jgi:uncharacterized protein YqjF (DUF2071 family)
MSGIDADVRTDYLGADSILYAVDHRPWMPPNGPWIMAQTWHDLAFLHYAIEPGVLRALVPAPLTLDLYGGDAWLSVVPFWMSHVRPAGVPAMPGFSRFCELNVRTYVTYEGKPGVYFFSLDAQNLSAVWGARVFYRLPYWHAQMKVELPTKRDPGPVRYQSKRLHGPKAANGMPEFRGAYGPTGEAAAPRVRSLDAFLTERYCLYAWNRQKLYRTEVHHLPWPLHPAAALVESNTMAEPLGFALPLEADLVHYARMLKVLVWPPERLK